MCWNGIWSGLYLSKVAYYSSSNIPLSKQIILVKIGVESVDFEALYSQMNCLHETGSWSVVFYTIESYLNVTKSINHKVAWHSRRSSRIPYSTEDNMKSTSPRAPL